MDEALRPLRVETGGYNRMWHFLASVETRRKEPELVRMLAVQEVSFQRMRIASKLHDFIRTAKHLSEDSEDRLRDAVPPVLVIDDPYYGTIIRVYDPTDPGAYHQDLAQVEEREREAAKPKPKKKEQAR